MGLQQFERRLERLVEGVFARAFRSGLQPVEIGRRLSREMDLRRQVAPKGVLAPNRFLVSVSPEDRARFEAIEDELVAELVSVAKDHAHTEGYTFVGPVEVELENDDDLSPGMLLVTGEMAASQAARGRSRPPAPAEYAGRGRAAAAPDGPPLDSPYDEPPVDERPGRAPSPAARPPSPAAPPPSRQGAATLVLPDGRRLVIGPRGLVVGRLPDCDLVLSDPNVSRRHAEIRPDGSGGFEVTDLGSTNGTKVNGSRVRGVQPLHDGDGVTVGATTLRFEQG